MLVLLLKNTKQQNRKEPAQMPIHLLTKPLVSGLLISLSINSWAQKENTYAIGAKFFKLNGKPHIIRCGEMDFAHMPKGDGKHRSQLAKAKVLNTVCAYLFGICKKNSRSVYLGQKLFKNI